jgi:hypothetical protein
MVVAEELNMFLSTFRTAVFRKADQAASARTMDLSKYGSYLAQRLVRWVLGACAVFAPTLALATPPQNLTDNNWQINGNGWPGRMEITQNFPAGRITGSMYGNTIVGYFANVERTMVLVRYSSVGIPMQAFVGTVSADGGTWSGKFYGLDVGPSGASQAQNVWSFLATRGTSSMPPAPPSPSIGPGPGGLHKSLPIFNRPLEFGWSQPGVLELSGGWVGNPNAGQLDGYVYGDELIGTYAPGANTVAFLRLHNKQPAQVFIGRAPIVGLLAWKLAGDFYPLTEEMGATPARLTYDWSAVVLRCLERSVFCD